MQVYFSLCVLKLIQNNSLRHLRFAQVFYLCWLIFNFENTYTSGLSYW